MIVGPAEPEQAAAFQLEFDIKHPVLADPSGEAYQAFELHEGGLRQLAGPRVFARAARARLDGKNGAGVIGNRRQLPGAVIIDRGGRIRFHQVAEHAGDTLKADDLRLAHSRLNALDEPAKAR